MNRKLGIVALIGACAVTLSGCSGGGTETGAPEDCTPIAEVDTVSAGKLTALVAEYPPFIYKDGGSVSGVDGELIKRTAEALCLELDVRQTSATAIIEGLKSGRADITAGDWTLNEERQQIFEVSDPVYEDRQGVMSLEGYDSVDELMGKNVGTVAGYLITPDMQKTFGTDRVKLYQSDVEAYQDLKAGRIDAHISGEGAIAFLLAQNNDTTTKNLPVQKDPRVEAFNNPSVAVALITRGNTKLRDVVNDVLAEYRDSGDLGRQLEADGVDPAAAEL